MNDYSLYKHTGKAWQSSPFYFGDGYKLCLAVYANGKGAGAGTHVSVELLQMKGEHDDKLKWSKSAYNVQCLSNLANLISIQMMAQGKNAQASKEQATLSEHFCSGCFTQLFSHEDLCVFKYYGQHAVSRDKFIDHRSAEQVMVLNDTIVLSVSLGRQE